MTPPAKSPQFSRNTLKLARQINASRELEVIPVEPGINCLPDNSFDNVREVVRRRGGSMQYGWSLREKPDVFVEGEFYCVWRSPDGRLIDVTPTPDQRAEVFFLPDADRGWQGGEVERRRLTLHSKPCYCGGGMPFHLCHGIAED
jgi:hypothetical protein